MIFDTDIIIWLFKGHNKAAKLVDSIQERHISIITYLEFIQGAKNRQELKKIKSFLKDHAFQTLPLTENIGHRASVYMEEYTLKTALYLADALIAATSVEHNAILCTANQKHYRDINELDLNIFKP